MYARRRGQGNCQCTEGQSDQGLSLCGTACRPTPCMTSSSVTAFRLLIGCLFPDPGHSRPISADDRYRGGGWRMGGQSKRSLLPGGGGGGRICAVACLPPVLALLAVLWLPLFARWPASFSNSAKAPLASSSPQPMNAAHPHMRVQAL